MSGLEQDKEIPRLHLPALRPSPQKDAEAEILKLFEQNPSFWWSRVSAVGGVVFAVALYLGIAFDFFPFLFSGSPVVSTARPPKAVPGWDDIASCGLLTSLDERKNLTFTEQAVEYAESPRDGDGVKPDSKMFHGTWSYDAGSKRYSVTLEGEMTIYTLVARGEPTTCILFMGELGAADLRRSWFSFPSADGILDYGYEPPEDRR